MGLRVKDTGTKMLARSPEAAVFLKENKGSFFQAARLIRQNFEELRRGGAKVIDKEKGLSIKKAGTGSCIGKHNHVTLKVTIKGKHFFLKIFEYKDYIGVLRGIRTAEGYLKRRNYRICGETIRPIKPHLLFENRLTKKAYIATDFFDEKDAVLVEDMPEGKKKKSITNAINELKKELEHKKNIIDIWPLNAFYQPKTDSVLLFGLQHYDYSK